ncbi:hypothetical protein ABH915_001833 [Arthrobacter sp. MW3 TE3886]
MGPEVTEIRDSRWLNFKDPDGNVPMICECWQCHGAAGMDRPSRKQRRRPDQSPGGGANKGGSG